MQECAPVLRPGHGGGELRLDVAGIHVAVAEARGRGARGGRGGGSGHLRLLAASRFGARRRCICWRARRLGAPTLSTRRLAFSSEHCIQHIVTMHSYYRTLTYSVCISQDLQLIAACSQLCNWLFLEIYKYCTSGTN